MFYDKPDSGLARRLSWVQEQIRAALDGAAPGLVRVVSLCAGQGRDIIGVLADHPRRTAAPLPLEPDAVMFTMRNHFRGTGPVR